MCPRSTQVTVQEAGEDEEDVDADVAARQERHARVPESHEQNRNSPQTLDVVSVRHRPALDRDNGFRPTLDGFR
jgi:hypothetical protein